MKSVLLLLLPVIYAAMPLFGNRFIPTHDGEYHIIRYWQFYTMLFSGSIVPRWAPELNQGFGLPLFTFQYPFPNLIGSILHLFGISYVHGVQWTLGIGYLSALVFCYMFLLSLFGKKPALLGTLMGAFVPYWFVDLYVRGSVGEVWAIAWIFASLFAISKSLPLLLVISVSLVITSHNILAMLFVPIIVTYAFIKQKTLTKYGLLGIGAASFFWIPALYEQQFITGISPVNVLDHFPEVWQLLIPSWGTGFNGEISGGTEMSYQIGVIPLIIIGIAAWIYLRNKKQRTIETACALIGCIVMAILLLPMSRAVWELLVPLHFIQYPWRLLSALLITIPILGAYIVTKKRWAWILCILAVIFSLGYIRPVTYEPRTDRQYIANPAFTGGTSSLGNAFTTIWMKHVTLPRIRTFSIRNGSLKVRKTGPVRYELILTVESRSTVTVPISYYPGWSVRIDQSSVETRPDGLGQLSFDVSPGSHEAIITLEETLWQRIAGILSVACLSMAFLFTILIQ